jgi:hypothetical protein
MVLGVRRPKYLSRLKRTTTTTTKVDAYKAHVHKLCKYFRSVVFGGEYSYNVKFVDTIPEFPHAAADVQIDLVYLSVTVRVSAQVKEHFRSGNWWIIADVICHEV